LDTWSLLNSSLSGTVDASMLAGRDGLVQWKQNARISI
jgi:hypothetical protein